MTPAPTAYLSVVEKGTQRYLAYLRAWMARASRSPRDLALRDVVRPLLQLLERAVRLRRLTSDDVRLPWACFARGGGHPELMNPWAVGLGTPSAPVLVLGSEPGYTLDSPEFLLEGLLLQALWLADAPVELAAAALECPAWSGLPFQRYPNDFYRAPLLSTWGGLAALLSRAWGGDPRGLLRPKLTPDNPAPHLFDAVYLLELSLAPADRKTAAGSMEAREVFLGELLSAMPEPRLLLIPGLSEDTPETGARERLAARFLGFPLAHLETCLQRERPTRSRDELRWLLQGDRGVLFCAPLRHEVEPGYWERAAQLIQRLLPERAAPPL
jgi:hypothetical protein